VRYLPAVIPIPPDAFKTIDFAKKSEYKPGDKDTNPADVIVASFMPKYASVEHDMCEVLGFEQKPTKRAQTFIY